MRILQVIHGMSPRNGGPSTAIADLARVLSQHAVDAAIYTTNHEELGGRLSVPVGRPVQHRGASITYYNVWPSGKYSFSFDIARALYQEIPNCDALHIHSLYNFTPFLGAVLARIHHVPYVLQLNGSLDPHLMKKNRYVKRAYLATFGSYMLRNASGLIFTSEAERKLAAFNVGSAPSHVIPVGLDWAEYRELPSKGEFKRQFPALANKRIVLFLGRLSPQKGLDILIPAFRLVANRHPDVRLVLAGPDAEGYGAQVEKWIGECDLQQRVTLAGRVPDNLKLAAYVDSSLFVLPSYAENFGAVVTEAMACGTPVVVSDRVNIHRDVAQAQAGIVVQCQVTAVADAIDCLLCDAEKARRLGANGRDTVFTKFTWDIAVRQLIAVYQSIRPLT